MLELLATLGRATAEPLWLPVAIWTVLALPTYLALNAWRGAHPLLQYRTRQALLLALPLACLAATVMHLWPTPTTAVPRASIPIGNSWMLPPVEVAAESPAGSPTESLRWIHGLGILTGGMLLLALGALGSLLVKARTLHRLSADSDATDRSLRRLAASAARCVRSNERARVAWTHHHPVPMTFGLQHPTVLMPRTLERQPDRLRLALLHEFVHVRRRDYLAGWIERLVTACFALHPLVQRLQTSIAHYRERACDAEVLRQPGVRPRTYATLLLETARPTSHLHMALAMASPSHTRKRIEAMKRYLSTDSYRRHPIISSILLATLVIALVGGVAACSEISPLDTFEEEVEPDFDPDEVYMVVEDDPQLIGGLSGLHEELQYPEEAREEGIEGRVIVQFIVNERGEVEEPSILQSPDESLSEEALRVVRQAEFEAGRQDDIPVKVRMSLPVTFRLNGEASEETSDMGPSKSSSSSHDDPPPPPSMDSSNREVSSHEDPPPPPTEEIHNQVEENPSLIGGMESLHEALEYPEFARRAGIEGRVIVQFVLDETGTVTQPEVLRSPHQLLSEEAVRVLQQTNWEPARQNGEAVKMRLSIPITFERSEDTAETAGTSIHERAGITPLAIRIRSDDAIVFEESVLNQAELQRRLTDRAANEDAVAVIFHVDPSASMGTVREAEHAARAAGITLIEHAAS